MPSTPLVTALPGLRASRWTMDGLYSAMKETHSVARVVRGRSEYTLRGRTWSSAPGALLLRQPGDFHRDVAREGRTVSQVVAISPALFDELPRAHALPHLEPGDPRGLVFHRLHDAIAAGADRLTLEVAVAEVIAQLAAITGAAPCSRSVRRAIEMMRARYADPLTLDELAAAAGLDKFRLCRAFRAQIGLPPHAYLTHLRIVRAKEFLVAGVPAGDVAHRVGLYDQSQLNRHFKKLVGTTPGKFLATQVANGDSAFDRYS